MAPKTQAAEQIDPETGEVEAEFVSGEYAPPANLPVPHVVWAISAITEAFSEVGIGKNRKNTEQKYTFRGVEDAMNALSSEIVRAKIILTPRFVRMLERSNHPTKSGGMMSITIIEMQYEFRSAIDNSVHTCTVVGEGGDYSDKATNKANSSAFKYMAWQQFCIPTQGMADDGDYESSTASQIGTYMPSAQERQQTGYQRARQEAERPAQQGNKSSAQAKKDGDWEYLTGSIDSQRTEEELEAWSRAHKPHIDRLPQKWKMELRSLYKDKLEEVRKIAWEEMERAKNGAPGPDCPF